MFQNIFTSLLLPPRRSTPTAPRKPRISYAAAAAAVFFLHFCFMVFAVCVCVCVV